MYIYIYICIITEILLTSSIKQCLYSFCIDAAMMNYEVMKKYVERVFLHFHNCMNYLLIRLTYTFTIWREGVVGGGGVVSTYCTDCRRKTACTVMPIYCIKSRGKTVLSYKLPFFTFCKYFSYLFIVGPNLSCCYL